MKTQLITALVVATVLGTAAAAMAVNADPVVSPDPLTIVSTDIPTPGSSPAPVVLPGPVATTDPLVTPSVDPTTDPTDDPDLSVFPVRDEVDSDSDVESEDVNSASDGDRDH
jgi:hypothetical protein